MTPHFVFGSCAPNHCSDEYRSKHCFADGKYCAHEQNHNHAKGRDIILEELRLMCLYDKLYGADKPGYDKEKRAQYWEYIRLLTYNCRYTANSDCSHNAHNHVGLDWEETNKCIAESFSMTETDS